ncbi:conserved hypothetical protein [Leptothrix cholodnii SP-6]|uniref:Mu-like prophage I protein n=1 Tax=Leptothrix cholodnii (strain ATCC 51168 / LMG 8142 / SP-6) TaxID=395495 RepID=B1Y3I3_LEPCP|nr:phage protease [Leptothrix cholodnii]ACB34511.1 conserved hypothetical protein [Leptothrix cholodnii SP-6]
MPSRKPRSTYIALLAAALSLGAQAEVQLLPAGEFAARDGRPGNGKAWTLSDAQGAKLAADLTAASAKSAFVFDVDHQTLRAEVNGQPAPAAGWATQFEWRAGIGLFATDVRWTEQAQGWIEGGAYRYVSPVITFDPAGRITGVLMAAITNYPALMGMEPIGRDLAAHLSSQFHTPTQSPETEVTLLAALIAAFGLKADANETEALNAVTALKAEAGALKDKAGQPTALSGALVTALGLKPGADEAAALQAVTTLKGGDAAALSAITALQAQVAALSAQSTGNQVEALVAQGLTDGRLLPALKDWATQLGKKDLTALQGFLSTAPKLLPGAGGQTNGVEPGADGVVALNAETKKVLTLMGITEEAWLKQYGKKA